MYFTIPIFIQRNILTSSAVQLKQRKEEPSFEFYYLTHSLPEEVPAFVDVLSGNRVQSLVWQLVLHAAVFNLSVT